MFLPLSGPVSRVLSSANIYLRIASPLSPSDILINSFGGTPIKEFVNLASGGVYIAPCVTVGAVGSYPAFSTLPLNRGGNFLLHFP